MVFEPRSNPRMRAPVPRSSTKSSGLQMGMTGDTFRDRFQDQKKPGFPLISSTKDP
jgi:hypothetical protein